MVVDHRGEQIVRSGDAVKVAGEVKVEVLERTAVRVAAARGAALHAKARAEARVAQTEYGLLADMVERVAEPDRRRRLAFAGRCRRDRGDKNELAVRLVAERPNIVERDLRLVSAIGGDRFARNAELIFGDVDDRPHRRRLRDLDVGFWVPVLISSARHGRFSLLSAAAS